MHQRVEADRDPVGVEKDADRRQHCAPADERGQENPPEEGAGAAEDRAALLRLVPPGDDVRPEPAHEQHEQQGPAAEDDDRGHGAFVHPVERDVEGAADREE